MGLFWMTLSVGSSGVKDISFEETCTKGLKCVVVGEVNSLEQRKL